MVRRGAVAATRNAILIGTLWCSHFAVVRKTAAVELGPPTDKLPLVLQLAHALPVRSIAFSADGKRVVTGAEDHTVIVWEASTGRQLGTLDEIGDDQIATVAISTTGRYVATGSDRGAIVVWDTDSCKKRRTLLWHLGPIVSLTFRGDRAELWSASADTTAVLWNIENGLKQQLIATKSPILGAAFSPNGRLAATNEENGSVVLWNVVSGKRVHSLRDNSPTKPTTKDDEAPVKAHQRGNYVAFSRDGKWLVAASPDKTAAVWDAETGAKLQLFEGYQEAVNVVGFSRDGKQVITTSYDPAITGVYDHAAIVWDAATGKKAHDLTLQDSIPIGLSTEATEIAVVSAGHIPSERQGVTLLSSDSGKPVRRLQSLVGGIPLAVSCDGKQMAIATPDEGDRQGTTLVFKFGKQPLGVLRLSPSSSDTSFSSDGAQMVEAQKDRIYFWDLNTGKSRPGPDLGLGLFASLSDTVFSPDLKQMLNFSFFKVDGKEGTPAMRLTDLVTGKPSWTFPIRVPDDRCVAFGSDGKQVAIATSKVVIYDTKTGAAFRTFVWKNKEHCTSIAFSRDGTQLAVATNDGHVGIWDIPAGRRLHVFPGQNGGGTVMAFSPNGHTLAMNNQSNELTLWNVAAGKRELVRPAGDIGYFHEIWFSPDNKLVAVIGQRMVVYWDVGTGEKRLTLFFLNGGSDWFAVTPNGDFDGSEAGRQIIGVRIGEGMNVVPVEQIAKRFYRPGLLNAILSGE
jgi:WD40 repeat protein